MKLPDRAELSTRQFAKLAMLARASLALILLGAIGCVDGGQEKDSTVTPSRAELKISDARIKSEVLAPWVGKLAPFPNQDSVGFHGADLGHVLRHGDQIRMLFGDGCLDLLCTPLSLYSDDSSASIDLQAFPDGTALERFIAAQVKPGETRRWQDTAAPALHMQLNAWQKVKPNELYRDGELLDLGIFRAPVMAFSNGGDGLFVVFERNVAVGCNSDGSGCPDGLSCDLTSPSCTSFFGELSACNESNDSCSCLRRPGAGLCVDRGTSVYADNDIGHYLSVAHRVDVAVEDPKVPGTFYSQPWVTQRFVNSAARSVKDFDPTRPAGAGNDYTAPTALEDPTRQRVLLWGRASSVGLARAGLDSKLYFAYADMPRYDPLGHFSWKPMYFTGMAGAVPQFSPHEADAVALDLSAGAGDTTEAHDIVFLSSVAYVPSLQRWVMFYGGGLLGKGLQHWLGSLASQAQQTPGGSILARFAEQPWGPWSQPVTVFSPGEPTTTPPVTGSEYASGGILHHPGCRGSGCAPAEPYIAPGEPGYLYAPYIHDVWTVGREPGKADIYWSVSSMVPYGIVLMHSSVELLSAGP